MLDVMGDLPVGSVAIFLLGSRILLKASLVRWSRIYMGCSSLLCCSCCFVGLILLLDWFMCPLAVYKDGGRYFLIRLIVKWGHLVRYLLLIPWSSVCFAGINSVV